MSQGELPAVGKGSQARGGKIQVGFLVSYDYELLKHAIPPVYAEADEIFLAIDKDRRTWSGNPIEIDAGFFEWLREFDTQNKIRLYEDSFYMEGSLPMECEVRERRMLAERMGGQGNWLIQLDSDEYFLEFSQFVAVLRRNDHYLKNPAATPIQICPFKINLYKYVDGGVLYVTRPERFRAATNHPTYFNGRDTGAVVLNVGTLALHEGMARDRDSLLTKLTNWGHKFDIDLDEFMRKWDAVNAHNFDQFRDFSCLNHGKGWHRVGFMPGNSIQELIANFVRQRPIKVSRVMLWRRNLGQWIKAKRRAA